tara:strand:+ start:1446 stop:2471 length:1026 start_codon:yes stop_codon:yes gene_type:complete
MKKSKFWHLSLFAFLVTGCSSLSTDKTALTQVSDSFPISSAIKALQEDVKTIESPWKEQVEAGISHLEKNELRKASTAFNTALGYKINDSAVQFLNGYTYHLIGLSGDNESFDLAAQGYDLSIKLDPSNWLARYQKGLLNLDRGNLDSAKLNFLDALIDQPNDIQILKKLIYSAYYTGDLEMAAAGNFQLCNLEPTGKHCLENRLLLAAALDAPDLGSQGLVENADASVISPERKSYLMERVASWQSIHSRIANAPEIGNVLTVSDTVEVEESSEGEATPVDDKDVSDSHNDNDVSPSDKARGNSEVFGSKMVITDVVIINSIEEATTSKGVNLLNSLVEV